MPQIIITATNPNFEGETYGVKFTGGRAVINEFTGKNRFGYTQTQLVDKFKRHPLGGYTVEIIQDALPTEVASEIAGVQATPPALRPKKSMPKVGRKKVPEAA